MGMSANRAILAEAYRQWDSSKAASDECWLAIVADNVHFGSSADDEASLPFAGPHKGRAELDRYFGGLVALVTTAWRNKKTGKSFEVAKAGAWTFKNGKVAAFFEYCDTAKLTRRAEANSPLASLAALIRRCALPSPMLRVGEGDRQTAVG